MRVDLNLMFNIGYPYHTHTHIHICMYACMYIYIYMCVYVCVFLVFAFAIPFFSLIVRRPSLFLSHPVRSGRCDFAAAGFTWPQRSIASSGGMRSKIPG